MYFTKMLQEKYFYVACRQTHFRLQW